jgi:two-component system NtrC family sensor kinase
MARQRPPERKLVALGEIVSDALEIVAYPLRTAGVEVAVDVDQRLPALWGDGDQINQVLMNLFLNAQQALMELDGKRRLAVSARALPAGDRVRIAISDNGPGVPEELRRRIFDPFFTTKPAGVGTGVGLSVCHGIILGHGGEIWVEETPGGGATFVIDLPVGQASEPAAGDGAPATPARIRGRHVLVIDDETEIAAMLAEILDNAGYRVTVADTGRAGLARLAEDRFDLVLSDVRMPDVDGRDIWKAVTDQGDSHPPIAFMTGDSLGISADFLAEADCPVLEKPFTPADAVAFVQQVLADPRRD